MIEKYLDMHQIELDQKVFSNFFFFLLNNKINNFAYISRNVLTIDSQISQNL